MKKKFLALVMTLSMMLSLVPMTALATENSQAGQTLTAAEGQNENAATNGDDQKDDSTTGGATTEEETTKKNPIVEGVKYDISSGYAIVVGCEEGVEELTIPKKISFEGKDYNVTKVVRGLQNNSTLKSVNIQAEITTLDNSIFSNDTSLTSVTLPDSLKIIETAAFENCASLTQINLPEGLEVIKNSVFVGTAIKDITLPSTLTQLQDKAFENVTTLKTVDFNDAATTIGKACFQGCNALETVSNTENVTELGDYAFGSDSQTVSSVNGSVNKHCQSLTGEIKLDSVTKIGKAAFKNCSSLKKVSGLNHVTVIPEEAFNCCVSLECVTGLENVTELGKNAFADCKAIKGGKYTTGITELEGLKLSQLTSIGAYALKSVQVAFDIGEDTFKNLTYLGAGAFSQVSGMAGPLTLPEGITSVGTATFLGTSITEVNLPNSIQSIGERAFISCTQLTSVQIGQKDGQSSELQRIEWAAFGRDTAIQSVIIEAAKSDVEISTTTKNGVTTFPAGVEQYIHYTVESIEGDTLNDTDDLQAAINKANNGDTIVATKSFLIKNAVTVPAGKKITLTGANITVQPEKTVSGPLFIVQEGATLCLDGTITYKCQNLANGIFAQVNGDLTLKNGTISRLSSGQTETGVIDVDGGSFKMEGGTISDITASGANFGAVYIHKNDTYGTYGTFSMEDGTISKFKSTNQYAGPVVVNGGSMTMSGGTIDGNTATEFNSAGGVLVNTDSTFTMTGGTISNNSAKRGGGVLVRENGQFKMPKNSKGMISGNTAQVQYSGIDKPNAGGGGVFVEHNASFEMKNGTITRNTTNGMGGGVATAVLNEDDKTGGGQFHMTGGTISNNEASCGGGVYSWSKTDRVVLEGGNIVNNTAYNQGGGVYVSTSPYGLTIKNALITDNKAKIMGGGVWACPTGTVTLGTDSAVFDNTAEKAGDDIALLNKNEGYYSTFSNKQLGGGLVTWYKDNFVTGNQSQWGSNGDYRYDANDPGNPVISATNSMSSYSLKAVVSNDGKSLAKNAAKLFIQDNTAQRGGGVGTNGEINFSGANTPENPISVTVHKVWSGNNGNDPSTVKVNLIRTKNDESQTIATVILSEKSKDKEDTPEEKGKTWSYIFSNLDDSYTYTVTEDEVPGYRTNITKNTEGNNLTFTITNTRKGGGGSGGGGTVTIPDDVPTGLDLKNHYGYIIGYPVDYYTGKPTTDQTKKPVRPEGRITRAEVATIYFRMLTDENRAANWNQVSGFSDVKSSAWYNNAISTLTKAGILKGYEDGTFQPNGYITRAEFATIAIRFFSGVYEGEDLFPDIKGHWAEDYINNAANKGLVKGYEDGTFGPDRYITRAEAVTLVNRTLNRHPHNDGLHQDMLRWPDNMDTSKWYYADMQEATNSHEPDKNKSTADKEYWGKMLPIRDWEALEKEWSNANSAPGEGEVV